MASGISKYILLGSVSLGSFIAGTCYEKLNENVCNNFITKKAPLLPIFGTVSAATTFSPTIVEPQTVNRVSQIMKHGFPGLDNVRSFDDFILSYDRRNRVAHWVFEHLTRENVKYSEGVDRSKCDFKPDESIHPYFR